MNRYTFAYMINYKDGTYKGPFGATIDAKTMNIAWQTFKRTFTTPDIAYVSLVRWQTVKQERRQQ